MKNFLKKLFSTLAIMLLIVYATSILINQEKELSRLAAETSQYEKMLDEALIKTEDLKETKAKINTDEYIEEYAREKLGLVMPYEIIFVDASI